MNKLEFTKTYGNKVVKEKQIIRLEKSLKIKIPKSYKKYILKYNGFGIYPDTFVCKENQGYNLENNKDIVESISLLEFYSLNDIKLNFEIDRIPKDLLTIGRDPGGNRILIGLYGEKKDKIYYWDHEREEELDDDFQSYINIYYLCDSFQDLINIDNLMDYDDDELAKEYPNVTIR